jgi:hypothetical protein
MKRNPMEDLLRGYGHLIMKGRIMIDPRYHIHLPMLLCGLQTLALKLGPAKGRVFMTPGLAL